jgi:hypothetical protein
MTSPSDNRLGLPWTYSTRGEVIDCEGNGLFTTSQTDAALIVRAVNAHEALVTMARRVAATTGIDGNGKAMRLDALKLLAEIGE